MLEGGKSDPRRLTQPFPANALPRLSPQGLSLDGFCPPLLTPLLYSPTAPPASSQAEGINHRHTKNTKNTKEQKVTVGWSRRPFSPHTTSGLSAPPLSCFSYRRCG